MGCTFTRPDVYPVKDQPVEAQKAQATQRSLYYSNETSSLPVHKICANITEHQKPWNSTPVSGDEVVELQLPNSTRESITDSCAADTSGNKHQPSVQTETVSSTSESVSQSPRGSAWSASSQRECAECGLVRRDTPRQDLSEVSPRTCVCGHEHRRAANSVHPAGPEPKNRIRMPIRPKPGINASVIQQQSAVFEPTHADISSSTAPFARAASPLPADRAIVSETAPIVSDGLELPNAIQTIHEVDVTATDTFAQSQPATTSDSSKIEAYSASNHKTVSDGPSKVDVDNVEAPSAGTHSNKSEHNGRTRAVKRNMDPMSAEGVRLRREAAGALLNVEQNLEEAYSLDGEIGKGRFGTVYKATCRKSGQSVAIKRVNIPSTRCSYLLAEMQCLVSRHSCFVQLIEIFEEQENLYFVMELMRRELFSELVENGAFSEAQARGISKNLARGLRFLHRNNYVHRDLKPENLLVDFSGNVKIADFGLARQLRVYPDKTREVLSGTCGTWAYNAPEMRDGEGSYDTQADVWALGVILYILLSGYHPFDPHGEANKQKILSAVASDDWSFDDSVWNSVSPEARDLVACMLAPNPARRPTATQVLQHPWFNMEDIEAKLNEMNHLSHEQGMQFDTIRVYKASSGGRRSGSQSNYMYLSQQWNNDPLSHQSINSASGIFESNNGGSFICTDGRHHKSFTLKGGNPPVLVQSGARPSACPSPAFSVGTPDSNCYR